MEEGLDGAEGRVRDFGSGRGGGRGGGLLLGGLSVCCGVVGGSGWRLRGGVGLGLVLGLGVGFGVFVWGGGGIGGRGCEVGGWEVCEVGSH